MTHKILIPGGAGFVGSSLAIVSLVTMLPLVGIVIYYRKNMAIAINIIILILVIMKPLEIYLNNILLILV